MMGECSDMLLVKALKDGSEEAWQEIFDRYHTILFYKAYLMLGSRQEAEDVLQEFYSTLWIKRETLEIKVSLSAFLLAALRNRCLNRLRDIKTYDKHKTGFINELEEAAYDPNQEDPRQFQLGALAAALQEVATDTAYPSFHLTVFGNKNAKETAEMLGLAPKTVRNQVSIIYHRLRSLVRPAK